jgi:protein SMG6
MRMKMTTPAESSSPARSQLTTRPRRKSGDSGSTITSGQLFYYSDTCTHAYISLSLFLSLVEITHNLLEISLSPSVPTSLRNIPTKYNIIARLWTFGFYKLLESLRQASFSSPLALEHLQDFIYYAYTFYTGLLEEPNLATFKSGWLEALGDLARYKMAVSALVSGSIDGGNALTDANVSKAAAVSDALAPPKADDAKSISDEPVAPRIDDSHPPSVGLAAARAMELEPEKERWRVIAREWYAAGLADQPGTGKLHHHIGLLSREVEGEELRGVYHYVKR